MSTIMDGGEICAAQRSPGGNSESPSGGTTIEALAVEASVAWQAEADPRRVHLNEDEKRDTP